MSGRVCVGDEMFVKRMYKRILIQKECEYISIVSALSWFNATFLLISTNGRETYTRTIATTSRIHTISQGPVPSECTFIYVWRCSNQRFQGRAAHGQSQRQAAQASRPARARPGCYWSPRSGRFLVRARGMGGVASWSNASRWIDGSLRPTPAVAKGTAKQRRRAPEPGQPLVVWGAWPARPQHTRWGGGGRGA